MCWNRYSEAIDILYAHNRFYSQDIRTLFLFTRTVLPHRLHLIRTIELAFSRSNLKSLSSSQGEVLLLTELLETHLPHLEELRIRTSYLDIRENGQSVLNSIKQMMEAVM